MKLQSIHTTMTPAKMIWVLICQAAVVVPHVSHLHIWVTAFCVLVAIWGYLTVSKHWRYPGMVVRFTLVIVACIGLAYSYQSIIGRDAGVALLIVMMS